MTNTNLRIPDEIYDLIKKIAELEERSINAQIVYILKKYAEDYFKKS
jgi:hypothetical protein